MTGLERTTDHQHRLNPHAFATRTPKRISITVPYGTYQRLVDRCDQEGRSLSNLAAFILELGIARQDDHNQIDHAAWFRPEV